MAFPSLRLTTVDLLLIALRKGEVMTSPLKPSKYDSYDSPY